MKSIKDILRERDIKYLCHFTKVGNLESIFGNGLCPRCDLHDEETNPDSKIVGIVNDQFRYDNHTDANCLSLSFPNSKMFYRFREGDDSEWVVIFFDAAYILLNKNCAFYPTNAASNHVRFQDVSNFQSALAFQQLFAGDQDCRQCLLPKDPTDVQAEVLVFDRIEESSIVGCVVSSDNVKENLEREFPDYEFLSTQGRWGVFDDRLNARKNGFEGY